MSRWATRNQRKKRVSLPAVDHWALSQDLSLPQQARCNQCLNPKSNRDIKSRYRILILEEMAEEDMVTVAGANANRGPTVGSPSQTTKRYFSFAARPMQPKQSATVLLELSLEMNRHKFSYS